MTDTLCLLSRGVGGSHLAASAGVESNWADCIACNQQDSAEYKDWGWGCLNAAAVI